MLKDFKDRVRKNVSIDDKREIEKYKRIIQEEPHKRPEVHFKLGKVYEKIGKKELAINEFSIAARLYSKAEDTIGAIAANKSIVHLDPENKDALADLAYMHHFQQDEDETLVKKYENFLEETEHLSIDHHAPSTIERERKKASEENAKKTTERHKADKKTPTKRRSRLAMGRRKEAESADKGFETDRAFLVGMIEGKVEIDEKFETKRESLVGLIKDAIDENDKPKTDKEVPVDLREETATATTHAETEEEWLIDLTEGTAKTEEDTRAEEECPVDLREATTQAADDVVSHLKRTPLFSKLCHAELQRLGDHVITHNIAANTRVMPRGNPQRSLFVLLDGIIHIIIKSKEGEESLLTTLGKGDFFGEFALFEQNATPLIAVAKNACPLLEIRKTGILALAKKCPHILEALKQSYRQRMVGFTS